MMCLSFLCECVTLSCVSDSTNSAGSDADTVDIETVSGYILERANLNAESCGSLLDRLTEYWSMWSSKRVSNP